MNKHIKALSVVLVCIVILSAISLNGIIYAENNGFEVDNTDILINDFNDITDVSKAVYNGDLGTYSSVSFDGTVKYGENGKSLKITTIPSQSSAYRRVRLAGKISSETYGSGFKLWISNPSQKSISLAVQFIQSGTWINMKPNYAYYTENSVGEVSQHLYFKKIGGVTEGCMCIEGGFEGFVYLPVDSAYSTSAVNSISWVVLSAYTATDTPVTYYLDEFSCYSALPGENWILRRFSEYENTEDMKYQMYIGGTQEVSLDSQNDACVIDTGSADKKSGVCFRFVKNSILNDHTGMRVRIKSSEQSDTEVLFKWEAKEHRPLKANSIYYLVDSEGNIYSKNASSSTSAALVNIPSGFDGWLYVPFSSAYPMDYSDIYRVYLNPVFEDCPGKTLSVFEISLYKELPVSTGMSYFINDFENYNSTQELKKALVNGNTTELNVSLVNDVWGSNSVKFSQDSEDLNSSFAVKFGASKLTGNFTGFKVRITVNKNANILIKSEDENHRPMKPNSLYYLVSSDGKAYSYTASNDSSAYVQMSSGFDGWIYIPFDSLFTIDLEKAYRLWFLPDKTNKAGTTFVVDDIVLYSGNPEVINDTPIRFERKLPYNPDNTVLDFDSFKTTEEMSAKIALNKGENVTVELDNKVSQRKNSCKFTFQKKGGFANTIVSVDKNSYFSEVTGFRFWIKASDAKESVSLLYKLETSVHRPLVSRAVYYLVTSDGSVFKRNASIDPSAAKIAIPAGFEGWVYVPFDSIYPMEIKDLYRIWFNFTASADASKNIWLDSISCYKDNPIASNTDIINDFNLYSCTADLLLDSSFQTKSEAGNYSIESKYFDGKSGKSFRIKAVAGGYKFSGLKNRNVTDYDGFVFYANNPSNKEVCLLPQTDSLSRDSFIPAKVYYLENKKTGAVDMKKFGDMVKSAGNIAIPAGFEGYVYLPYSSAYPSLQKNITKLNSFWLTVKDVMANDAEIYIDTIAFYKNSTCRISNILMWKQDTMNMLYGFEKSNSFIGYRGWISPKNDNLDVSVSKKYSHSGTNSLKISTNIKSADEAKNSWAVTSLSLKNEDGTCDPVNMYDGIAFWIKVERDGTATKPLEDKVQMGFKVDMPSQGRLNTTSPIYILEDGSGVTNPKVYTKAIDGCTAIDLSNGFSGMIYIPFSELKPFAANGTFDVNKGINTIYIMFRLHSLIGYNVYVDDVQGYNTKNLINVNWPGDSNYSPLSDPMLQISTQKYAYEKPTVPNKTQVDNSIEKNKTYLPIILISVAVLVSAVSLVTFLYIRKKKSKKA